MHFVQKYAFSKSLVSITMTRLYLQLVIIFLDKISLHFYLTEFLVLNILLLTILFCIILYFYNVLISFLNSFDFVQNVSYVSFPKQWTLMFGMHLSQVYCISQYDYDTILINLFKTSDSQKPGKLLQPSVLSKSKNWIWIQNRKFDICHVAVIPSPKDNRKYLSGTIFWKLSCPVFDLTE